MSPTGAGTQTDAPTESYYQDTDGGSDRELERPKLLVDEEKAKKYKSLRVRTISTVTLIVGFIGFVWAGHVPLLILLMTLQALSVKELFVIARVAQTDRKLPGFRAQQWYFFVIAEFFLMGRFIKNNLLVEVTSGPLLSKIFTWTLRRHTLVSFFLYMAGFVTFVLSLKKRMMMYQFSQFAWTHTIILVVVVPSSFLGSNLFEGIIWWMLPGMLVVANDIFAYLAGLFFGRTPLISLSPKKTVEGFTGGAIGAVVMGVVLSTVLARYKWMVCPRKDLSFGPLTCPTDEIYLYKRYTWNDLDEFTPDSVCEMLPVLLARLPGPLREAILGLGFTAMPIQVHAMFLALFASLIAPFGGFMASGFKRAFKVKDFGDTIPGHGGITDRFDCHVIMSVFMYVYWWTYISKPELSVGDVLSTTMRLGNTQQLELFVKLANLLVGEGLLPGRVMNALAPIIAQHGFSDGQSCPQ
mmetsp:Transcript_11917/g.21187  ORF Transcript_11917/g.21187 Transcript_11917/m.21187 type:complete len:467 (-) Transcript_11917:791-2191(-)